MGTELATPGQWSVGRDDVNLQPTVVSDDGKLIATCSHECIQSRLPEARANAQLIALAPEMLEICEELLNTVAENGELNFRTADLTLVQIRHMAAIVVQAARK